MINFEKIKNGAEENEKKVSKLNKGTGNQKSNLERPAQNSASAPILSSYKIKRICAWCNKLMGYKKSKVAGITHGVCKICLQKQLKKLKELIKNDKKE